MKDFRSIFLNLIEARRYKSWVTEVIRGYSSEINNPLILDVGCGSNKISNSKKVTGCDIFPVSKDVIKAAADDLPFEDGAVDILVSTHCLEHMANPIKTINEWRRVIGKVGVIWFVLPHGSRTFDSHRPLTTTSHVIDDFNNETTDDDQTHWPEFRDLTVLSGHRLIPKNYISKAKGNDFNFFYNQRLIHHHVWTLNSFIELISTLGLETIYAVDEVPGRNDSFSVIVRNNPND